MRPCQCRDQPLTRRARSARLRDRRGPGRSLDDAGSTDGSRDASSSEVFCLDRRGRRGTCRLHGPGHHRYRRTVYRRRFPKATILVTFMVLAGAILWTQILALCDVATNSDRRACSSARPSTR